MLFSGPCPSGRTGAAGAAGAAAWARLRVRAQKDEAFYRARCTDVLVNDCGSAAAFTEKARQALETILKEERA